MEKAITELETNKVKVKNFGGRKIGDDGVIAIANALKHNTSLTELLLHNNSIGELGTTSIANVLKHNSSLTNLDFGHNNIGDTGATNIVNSLKKKQGYHYIVPRL